MSTFQLKFDTGAIVTLRATPTKDGKHQYLAARPSDVPYVASFGVNVAATAVGGRLPKSAELLVDGKKVQAITLEAGATKGNDGRNGKKVTPGGKPLVHGAFPEPITFDGDKQNLKIERISMTPGATSVNVLIRSAREAGGKVHSDL